MQRAGIQSLVKELRSHMPHGATKREILNPSFLTYERLVGISTLNWSMDSIRSIKDFNSIYFLLT